ncbi:MAG: iron dicitrate transport regulator FecR [Candidatus Nitrohelix vancouverensis]|uniref:protein acetyllysine N-acetyltransferase n=1 Tax=Candidatus Nitrohelix vancouverensis TaxID=2705534 RepID=A0A7T0G4A2_9BACT|nr:MAG: iron dicitrate transport regulator FecR [Candidatus Nitrohelix vancouverensis]
MANVDSVVEAAKLLVRAKRVLFLTSAGMSADSNIPTFRDKEGYWRNFPPFREKNLEAQDLASPWAFRNELPHAWAFYEWRRRNATENTPHEGYAIINEWMANRFEDSFIHTTNTDGYHLRSGAPLESVMEVHGSMWRLQCLDVCTQEYWPEETSPLCELDLDTMKASNYPTCKNCGAIARPHILMFGDGDYVGHAGQEAHFVEFLQQPVDLGILIGSSGAVPTNDYIASRLQSAGARIININPDLSANRIVNTDHFISLPSKAALTQLNDLI